MENFSKEILRSVERSRTLREAFKTRLLGSDAPLRVPRVQQRRRSSESVCKSVLSRSGKIVRSHLFKARTSRRPSLFLTFFPFMYLISCISFHVVFSYCFRFSFSFFSLSVFPTSQIQVSLLFFLAYLTFVSCFSSLVLSSVSVVFFLCGAFFSLESLRARVCDDFLFFFFKVCCLFLSSSVTLYVLCLSFFSAFLLDSFLRQH